MIGDFPLPIARQMGEREHDNPKLHRRTQKCAGLMIEAGPPLPLLCHSSMRRAPRKSSTKEPAKTEPAADDSSTAGPLLPMVCLKKEIAPAGHANEISLAGLSKPQSVAPLSTAWKKVVASSTSTGCEISGSTNNRLPCVVGCWSRFPFVTTSSCRF
jgi:hypothetical protein